MQKHLFWRRWMKFFCSQSGGLSVKVTLISAANKSKVCKGGRDTTQLRKKILKIVFERLPLAVRVARIVNKRVWDIYVIRH